MALIGSERPVLDRRIASPGSVTDRPGLDAVINRPTVGRQTADAILRLQRDVGNREVSRLVAPVGVSSKQSPAIQREEDDDKYRNATYRNRAYDAVVTKTTGQAPAQATPEDAAAVAALNTPSVHEGVNLKDKRLAGVKPEQIKYYTKEELGELGARSKYKNVKALKKEYRGETRGAQGFNTKYLKEAGRELFKLDIAGGTIRQRGAAYKTGAMESYSPHSADARSADTEWSTAKGAAMYVMDPDGNFYAAGQQVTRIHHSSLLAGGPVAAAGQMKMDDGTLTYLDNNSGHYTPTPDHLWQALEELQGQNVAPSSYNTAVTYKDHEGNVKTQRFPKPAGEAFLQAAKTGRLAELLPGYAPKRKNPPNRPGGYINEM